MKLHLPSCLRRLLLAVLMAGCCYHTVYAAAVPEHPFYSDEELSGEYEGGFRAYDDACLTNYGAVSTAHISLQNQSSLMNSGTIHAKGGVWVQSSASLLNKSILHVDGTLGMWGKGTVTNTGTLNANGGIQYGSTYASGGTLINHGKLKVQGDIIGNGTALTNTGELNCDVIRCSSGLLTLTNSGTLSSKGIQGSLHWVDNSGTITIDADSGSYGIYSPVYNSADGTIVIKLTGTDNSVQGIHASAPSGTTLSLCNEGRLDIEALSNADTYGISTTFPFINGRSALTTIAVTSHQSSAYGISAGLCEFSNDGELDISADAATTARGVTLSNIRAFRNNASGRIAIKATGNEASGLYATRYGDGTNGVNWMYNDGMIDISSQGQQTAYGIYLSYQSLNNSASGSISINSVGGENAGCGFYLGSSSKITNAGTIKADVFATEGDKGVTDADIYGMQLMSRANLENTGSLSLNVSAGGGDAYGIYVESSRTRVLNVGESANIHIESNSAQGAAYGIYASAGSIANTGTMDIVTAGAGKSYGVYLKGASSLYNAGTLTTDSVVLHSSSTLYLMHDSTLAAHSAQNELEFLVESEGKPIIYLGRELEIGDTYKTSTVEGGSKLKIASSLTLSSHDIRLQDHVTLEMGGDFTIGSDSTLFRNGYRFTIDNGDTPHTVSYQDVFSASWDGAAIFANDSTSGSCSLTWSSEEPMAKSRSRVASPQQLSLLSGTLTVYAKDSELQAPSEIDLQPGTLNLSAGSNSHVHLTGNTITWRASDASTPVLKVSLASGTQYGKMTWDADTVRFNFQKVNKGDLLLSLNVSDNEAEHFSFMQEYKNKKNEYTLHVKNGEKGSDYLNYNCISHIIKNSPETEYHQKVTFKNEENKGTYNSVTLFNGNLYSTEQKTTTHRLLDTKTYRGDKFITYDTEKYKLKDANGNIVPDDKNLPDDHLNCGLISGMHMAMTWLDRYAPLGNAGELMPQLIYGEKRGESTLRDPAATLGGKRSVYDFLCGYYPGGYSDPVNMVSWILTGKTVTEASMKGRMADYTSEAPFYAAGLPKWTCVSVETDGSFTEESVEYGKIYGMNVTAEDGVISNVGSTLTQIIKAGFSEKSSAPLALGYNQVSISSGETGGHAVTCYGYDTSIIEGVEYVTKLWLCDSDDKSNEGEHVVSCDIIYGDDGRAYLANPERPGVINYIATIAFMTDPEGMDKMLDDYYNESKPIYWTGTNTEWKKDNIGGRESQTRLATLSDGWRKQCEGGGRSIWAYTTFSGSKEDVVFGESVNGVSVKERNITVHDTVDAGTVQINGKGYVWNADGDWAKVSAKSLLVNSGSLTIGKTLEMAVTDNIVVQSGASLKNYGLIEGNVYLAAGSEFHTGLIYVSQGEEPSALNVELGNGLYGHVVNRGLADGSGVVFVNSSTATSPYTLGTTVNFGNATITREMYKAVENGTLAGLVELAQLGIFGEGGSNEYVRFEFEPTHYKLQGRVDAFLDMFKIRKGEVSILAGDAPGQDSLSIGSYGGHYGTSAANLQLSAVEGGTLRAEVGLETLAGERTLVNAESSVEAQTLRVVAGSELENDGELRGRVEVEGTLSGSGYFGVVLAHEGGSIVIGNSPGAAEYESLTLKNGSEIVFSVDGLTPAAEDLSGWGSGAHSVLTLTGTDALTLEDRAEVKIGFSADFLTSVEIGKPQTLTLIQGVAANDELLAALQQATSFYYAGLDDSLSSLAENTLYSVHEFSWQAGADNSIALNVTLYYAGQGVVPEPTTTTLSLLAFSMLAARRRRR